jgi:hypothetical protein
VKYVRVKPPVCVLRHPDHGGMVAPDPSLPYQDDDPLVKAYPWQFQADDDKTADDDPNRVVTEVQVEQAPKRRPTRK